MKLTAITCTYGRHEAMLLCEKYVKRQTRQPDQWLVLDDPRQMPAKVLDAIERNLITGDLLVFSEDDDWFRADWYEWLEKQAEKGYDLIGEGHAAYYHVSNRWWSFCWNVHHAALCQTAITRELFTPLCNVIKAYSSPFFDVRLWQIEANKRLALPASPAERRVVGIKGMPGLRGYSGEHVARMPERVTPDPSLLELWKWIGEDASAYSPFYERTSKLTL